MGGTMGPGFRRDERWKKSSSAEFCEKYDAPAFDPGYETLPLDFFEPMLRRVISIPKQSMYRKVFAD